MRAYAVANLEAPPDAGFWDRVRRLSDAGVDFILLRDKGLDDASRFRNAERARAIVAPPSRLLVHGRADLAVAVGGDGVHLAASGIPAGAVRRIAPAMVIGRSCHSAADCAAAARERLSYALLGPLFATRSKRGEGRIDPKELARAATLGIDVYALGGISRARLGELEGLPIRGVAAVTLFMEDEPLEEIVTAVHEL